MIAVAQHCLRCRSGVTAIEYALVAGLIALAIVSGATQIGGTVKQFFTTIGNSF